MYLTVLALDIASAILLSAVSGGGSFGDVSHRIIASETLYRMGLCLSLGGSLATVLLAVGLYVTVKPADPNLAIAALLFRTCEAAIGGVGIILSLLVLQVYLAPDHANAFDSHQLGALADLQSIGSSGTSIAAIFFCFGSTVFFYVFLKSRFIPRLMAAWGLFASVVYAAAWFFVLIAPHISSTPLAVGSIPILIAEVATGLWLLLAGVRVQEAAA